MEKYDAALILTHELENRNGETVLCSQTKARTDLGISLLREGKVDKLIMTSDCQERYGISLARAMKNYAIKQGVEEKQIVEEDISLDTAGELVFGRLGILEPRNWRKIVIITNEWHYRRIKEEADFILRGFKVDYKLVKDDSLQINVREREKEDKSLAAFLRTFEGVNPENDEEVLQALLTKHHFYNQNSDSFRKRLADLIKQNGRD